MGRGLSDISLMEELIHVYQLQQGADWKTEKLNCEIEAKLGWFMYRQRIGNTSNLKNKLGGEKGYNAFTRLNILFWENRLKDPEILSIYGNITEALGTIGNYGDEECYPFDPTQMEFNRLLNLMKDCLKTQK